MDCFEVTKDGSNPVTLNVKGEDGQKMAVGIQAGADAIVFPKDRPTIEWQVTVVTANTTDAAFDGSAFLTVAGNDGSSEEQRLANDQQSNFDIGSSCVFKVGETRLGNNNPT